MDIEQYQKQWQLTYAQYFATNASGSRAAGGAGPSELLGSTSVENNAATASSIYYPQNPQPFTHHPPPPITIAPKKKRKESKFKEDPVKEQELVDTIVNEMKSKGLVDKFRRDVMGGCESNLFYQALNKKVNSTVNSYLDRLKWIPTLNRNVLRESMKRKIEDPSYYKGIERILQHYMETDANGFFMPYIEEGLEDHMPKKEKVKPEPAAPVPAEPLPSADDAPTPTDTLPQPCSSTSIPADKVPGDDEGSNADSVDMECDSDNEPTPSTSKSRSSRSRSGSDSRSTSSSNRDRRHRPESSTSSSTSRRSRRSRKSSSSNSTPQLPRTPDLQQPIPSQEFNDSEDMELDDEDEEESPAFEKIGESPTNSPVKSLATPIPSSPPRNLSPQIMNSSRSDTISPEVSPCHYFQPLSSPIKRKLAYFTKYVDPLLMESDVSLPSGSDEEVEDTKKTPKSEGEEEEIDVDVEELARNPETRDREDEENSPESEEVPQPQTSPSRSVSEDEQEELRLPQTQSSRSGSEEDEESEPWIDPLN